MNFFDHFDQTEQTEPVDTENELWNELQEDILWYEIQK